LNVHFTAPYKLYKKFNGFFIFFENNFASGVLAAGDSIVDSSFSRCQPDHVDTNSISSIAT